MLLNWETKIVGSNVILVPYCEHHVEKYHRWMQSEELQRLTGSEPLTLEQEYEMQASWRDSEDKCTFIILDKILYQQTQDEVQSMVGDTNLFLGPKEESEGGGELHQQTAEAEIMIAESAARGRKLGWESINLMLKYGAQVLRIGKFEAKIKHDNLASIKMFEKLGFEKVSERNVFGEVGFAATLLSSNLPPILDQDQSAAAAAAAPEALKDENKSDFYSKIQRQTVNSKVVKYSHTASLP